MSRKPWIKDKLSQCHYELFNKHVFPAVNVPSENDFQLNNYSTVTKYL